MTKLLRAITLLAFVAAAFPLAAAERITYHHFDALGSTVAVTDEQGNVIWRETYQPYGERIQNQTASANNTRWYTGHSQDPETGLVYAGARYYDPVVGRFYAVDPKGFAENNLQSFNRYAYGNNNPYKYIDPDGQMSTAVAVSVSLLTIGGLVYVADPVRQAQMARDVERIGQNVAGGMQWVGDRLGSLTRPIFAKPPENARDPNGPKAPGKPGAAEGFTDPTGGENWVPNPNPGRGGASHGWQDDKGRVWVPTGHAPGRAHGGPHWDVQDPRTGGNTNVRPGQNISD